MVLLGRECSLVHCVGGLALISRSILAVECHHVEQPTIRFPKPHGTPTDRNRRERSKGSNGDVGKTAGVGGCSASKVRLWEVAFGQVSGRRAGHDRLEG